MLPLATEKNFACLIQADACMFKERVFQCVISIAYQVTRCQQTVGICLTIDFML